ncbi:MAG: Holliday junction branch migration protein RuvA [Gammaproteobacteria bacterium]|nr:Holliday junction branch migration protein RuvA [Gammaproteobacteria bacterium]
MIGRLKGILSSKQPPNLLLDVNGVGYEIQAPMSTFYTLPEPGETVQLLIHTHVREDALQLYGFASTAERELFRTLIKVSGVGAKLALTILSGIDVSAFIRCVHSQDSTSLTRLPGVGKKTAERLIVEMKDKLIQSTDVGAAATAIGRTQANTPIEEAVTALIALGYKPPEASRMVRSIPDVDNSGNTEDIIRLALKAVMR